MFTIYHADCVGQAGNCLYPHKIDIIDQTTLEQAVSHDYVCAEYAGSYRNNANFLGSNCLPVDCDNDHSDDPEDWKYPSDVADAFPGVAFAVHYSRNNMKVKGGKAARPKFHVLFAIDPVRDAEEYSNLKKLVSTIFPYFDTKALDAARFFFGTPNPKVELFDGPMTLNTFLDDDNFDAQMDFGSYGKLVIPEGSRNATMSHYAGRILKRYGDTEEAHRHFLAVAGKCDPPLESAELDAIWRSARRFYGKVSPQTLSPSKPVWTQPQPGADIWQDALNTFFLGDRELIDYVQEIVGLAAIGKVYIEALIIAYGEGRNGKSTFWNTISRVLSTYSGNMSADTLTVDCKQNVKPELAEAKGKRLIIAAELEEGMRLNTSNVKQLCSTDEIYAEKKYKDPFSYVPSHTLVLYTNHLPKVGAMDAGT